LRDDCTGAFAGTPSGMSEHEQDQETQEREPQGDDPLLEAQEHKGYGEDEGEREESLPEE
jgi:hypothetical protein